MTDVQITYREFTIQEAARLRDWTKARMVELMNEADAEMARRGISTPHTAFARHDTMNALQGPTLRAINGICRLFGGPYNDPFDNDRDVEYAISQAIMDWNEFKESYLPVYQMRYCDVAVWLGSREVYHIPTQETLEWVLTRLERGQELDTPYYRWDEGMNKWVLVQGD